VPRVKKAPASVPKPKSKRKKTVEVPQAPKRGRGAPTVYREEIASEICERLAVGETLLQICRTSAYIPKRSTILGWVLDNREGFSGRYARARELCFEAWADEVCDIADDATNDWMTREGKDGQETFQPNAEHINRSRLRVDSRKWLLSKLKPQKYGERAAVELTGKDGKDLNEPVDKMELARWVAFTMISAKEEARQLAKPEEESK
jgi:hypothetical protein